MKILKYFLFFLLLLAPELFTQTTIDGHWEGNINVGGNNLVFKVNFQTDTDSLRGTLDIPMQQAENLKLIHCKYKGSNVYFELPSKLGLASFDGTLAGDSIFGNFAQATIAAKFILYRGEMKSQNSQPEDVPYNQEEVTFTNGDNKFAGTLTTPFSKGKHPAVVMITGSGAQNRDEEILGFKVFKVIANHFTRSGIAVLRYDDRGVGGSTGKSNDESTTEDFSNDVIEAVKYLKTRDDINPDQVGLCGHSEGGVVAPLVASKYNGIAFIVLIAGTGVKGIDILKEQSSEIMKTDKSSDKEIKGYLKMLDEVYKISQTNSGWKEFREKMKTAMAYNYDNMNVEERNKMGKRDDYVNTMTDITMNQFQSPWMKYFMSYDPIPALIKVNCPVLMLFGEKDLQVPVKQNEKPMVEAQQKGGNKDYTSKTMPMANHLFQTAITGSPSEYASLPKEFVPGFLDTMSEWILQRVTIVK